MILILLQGRVDGIISLEVIILTTRDLKMGHIIFLEFGGMEKWNVALPIHDLPSHFPNGERMERWS